MMTYVLNMATGQWLEYTLMPEDAVIAAYAQEKGDYNTWDYNKYKSELVYGNVSVSCGDWGALLEFQYQDCGDCNCNCHN